jgi:hypothetical protein
MKYKITKISNRNKLLKEKYNNTFTNDFRGIVKQELGELDTPHSFMYLYRRFQKPNAEYRDDFKIFYSYSLLVPKNVIITIHGSYHQHVYFGLHIPQHWLTPVIEKNRGIVKDFALKSVNVGIPFIPYKVLYGLSPIQSFLGEEFTSKNWELIDLKAEQFWGKNKKAEIEEKLKSTKSEGASELEDLIKALYKEYIETLSEEEIRKLNHALGFPEIKDIDGLEDICRIFINDLKKGVWVRDVLFNIKGYESEENQITEHFKP